MTRTVPESPTKEDRCYVGLKEALKKRAERKKMFDELDEFFLDQQERIEGDLKQREEAYQSRLRYHGQDRKTRLSLTLLTPDQEEGGVWQARHSSGKKKPTSNYERNL